MKVTLNIINQTQTKQVKNINIFQIKLWCSYRYSYSLYKHYNYLYVLRAYSFICLYDIRNRTVNTITLADSFRMFIDVYRLQIVVCPFVLFLLAIVLSILLRFTDSNYPFGVFKIFLSLPLYLKKKCYNRYTMNVLMTS